ncbi:MAG: QueT transporter family protein, partial [Oscillospiraceae bacterium]|nr:QueT transporter family protein [Oscillospiraceae bacterium]
FLAATGMWHTRCFTIKKIPLLGLMMPAITNAFLVGWELMVYIGGGFWINALYVAIGEALVLFTLGMVLYFAIKARQLDKRLF